MHKRLVAGLSGLVTCLQSNFIGTNFRGLFSNLGVHGLFSSPFVSYWAHIDWLAPGYLMGVGNLTISGEAKLRSRPPVMVLTLAASHLFPETYFSNLFPTSTTQGIRSSPHCKACHICFLRQDNGPPLALSLGNQRAKLYNSSKTGFALGPL